VSQPELLKTLVRFLENVRIEYMLTGSLVSSLQGEPRATHDIDVVVQIDQGNVPEIIRAFPPPRYYLNEPAIREAVRDHSMFNLLDVDEGDKVDFWLLTAEPFDSARFSRRRVVSLLGMPMAVSAPEDTILAKLRWTRLSGGSEKQFTDALRVYELQRGILDLDYLVRWVGLLQIEQLWSRLQSEAEPLADET
jgi:hypothetical protein